MNSTYLVSIRLMTFNHEEFIRDAMNGIMMQKTNFKVEIVIGNDFSTDNTLQIIKEYKSTENIHIKILERSINNMYWQKRQKLGRLYNFTNIIQNCTGKYIALLDGDDYWSDANKLQKQVDFLERNIDCIVCHHWHEYAAPSANGYVLSIAPTKGQGYLPDEKSSVKAIFENRLRLKSRTLMFRNVIEEFPSWFYEIAYGDVALSMLLGRYGDFGFINERMAVYRRTGEGISTKGQEHWLFTFRHYKEYIRVWECGNNYYNGKFKKETLNTIYYFYNVIFQSYNYRFRIFVMSLKYALLESQLSFFTRFRIIYRLMNVFISERMKRKQGK